MVERGNAIEHSHVPLCVANSVSRLKYIHERKSLFLGGSLCFNRLKRPIGSSWPWLGLAWLEFEVSWLNLHGKSMEPGRQVGKPCKPGEESRSPKCGPQEPESDQDYPGTWRPRCTATTDKVLVTCIRNSKL